MFTHQTLLYGLAALYLMVYGPAIVNPKRFSKAMKSLLSNEDLTRLMGGLLFLVSAMFLSVQASFTKDWAIIVPIIGWGTLIKAAWLMWFPKSIKTMWKQLGKETTVALLSLLVMAISIGLIYVATELLPGIEIVAG